MPINKKDNKKNAPKEKRDSAKVPQKEKTGKKLSVGKTKEIPAKNRVNALATQGKKKKPYEVND